MKIDINPYRRLSKLSNQSIPYFLPIRINDNVNCKKINQLCTYSTFVLIDILCCVLLYQPYTAIDSGRKDERWMTLTLALVGKFGISAGFAIICVYSAELFPTVMRNSAIGFCSVSARIGGILAPYIAKMVNLTYKKKQQIFLLYYFLDHFILSDTQGTILSV